MAPRDRKQERREQILEGLFEAMALFGGRDASITDIANAAGIARGALHYYFESKEEIRVCLMERLGDRYIGGLEQYLKHLATHRPAALVAGLVKYHLGGPEAETERMLTVWLDYWGNAPADDSLNGVMLSVQERARDLCWFVARARRPELAGFDDVAARHHAAALLALIEGAMLQWRMAARTERPLARDALSTSLAHAVESVIASFPAPLHQEPPRGPEATAPRYA